MAICVNCGKESDLCLCNDCKKIVDVEELCDCIMEYDWELAGNQVWNQISAGLYQPRNFTNIIFALTDELESPRKEYRRILCMAGDMVSVPKASRQWLYDKYKVCKDSEKLSALEQNRVKGLVLDALYKDYYFEEAEDMAVKLVESEELPIQVYMTLGDFYTKTRRYEAAEEFLNEAKNHFSSDEAVLQGIQRLLEDNEKQREKAENGKQEYMPNPKENRDEVRKRYVDFLAMLGIEAEVPVGKVSKVPKPIPRDQYPNPIETRDADFDTFVAFDLETTGRNSKIDSIIEIGAIKVVGGKVVDSKEFVFQEFVKPFKRKVSNEVQQLTGISQDDVKDAREMWDVTPDFIRFVGDNTLVGFNCVAFDSRFLVRAGRYSHAIIENKYFDVMRYADKFREQLGLDGDKCSLGHLSQKLGVKNPRAHRALADAITTAQVFLKLKELDEGAVHTSVDDMLVDIDDW